MARRGHLALANPLLGRSKEARAITCKDASMDLPWIRDERI